MKFNKATAVLFLLLLGACTVPPHAEILPMDNRSFEAEVGDLDPGTVHWRLGDRWQYSDGYHLEVSEVTGTTGLLRRLDKPGSWIQRRGLFKMTSLLDGTRRKVVFRSRNPESLFPLKKGNKVVFDREFLAGDKLRVHRTSWEVAGSEIIEVPAGMFECWVLVWRTKSKMTNWTGYEKWWYSPVAGNYVRMEFQYGRFPPSSRVLMRYDRGEVSKLQGDIVSHRQHRGDERRVQTIVFNHTEERDHVQTG